MIDAALFWSGGKDSALALHKIRLGKLYNIKFLVTTINEETNRIAMHGVREELLDLQAKSIGLPLIKMKVPTFPSNDVYEQELTKIYSELQAMDIKAIIFGDIFLEDLRDYRLKLLNNVGLAAIFPLWKQSSHALIGEFIALGFKTILTCINAAVLSKSFLGREINDGFIREIPDDVDPCGENGEFHTFCYAGPIFHIQILTAMGEVTYRPTANILLDDTGDNGFWYIDLLPNNNGA